MTNSSDSARDGGRSIGPLIEVAKDGVALVRQEMHLARQETVEKLAPAAQSTGMMLSGGLLGIFGSICLLQAIVHALSTRMPLWQASLLSGGLFTVGGILLAGRGGHQFKKIGIIPQKTINSLKEDKEWLRRQIKSRLI